MKNAILFLLLLGAAHAQMNLSAGQCQNLTLYNESANVTYNETVCAANGTIILNVTNVTGCANFNITLNASEANNSAWLNTSCNGSVYAVGNTTTTINNTVLVNNTVYVNQTQNVSVLYCPATNTTLTANGTITVNNQTVSCVSNAAAGACNFTATVYPGTSQQVLQNISGLSVTVAAIPLSYCYENRNERANTTTVWRSDICNDTFICEQGSLGQCPAQVICQECSACDNTGVALTLSALNNSIYGANGWQARLQASQDAYGLLNGTCGSIGSTVNSAVRQEVGQQVGGVKQSQDDFGNMIFYGLVAAFLGVVWYVIKSRASPAKTNVGKIVSKDEVDKVLSSARRSPP